jgi:hypothetical protein
LETISAEIGDGHSKRATALIDIGQKQFQTLFSQFCELTPEFALFFLDNLRNQLPVLAAKRLNQITRKPAHSPPPLFLSRRCRELLVDERLKLRLSQSACIGLRSVLPGKSK